MVSVLQCVGKVGLQVADVFEADGHAQQAGWRLGTGPFHGSAMFNETFHAAKAGGGKE